MTSVFVALLSLALLAVVSASLNAELNSEWKLFKVAHNKQYPSGRHELKRRQIWESNLDKINAHNARFAFGQISYEMGMNHLGDLTNAERKSLNGFKQRALASSLEFSGHRTQYVPSAGLKANATVDWRLHGAVTDVKDQKDSCGSCWAFTAVGAIEGQHVLRKQGLLVSLSAEQLDECAVDNGGCDGGMMDDAYNYVIKAGGIATDACYPYKSWDSETCHFNKSDSSCIGANITGLVDIQPGNETALQCAVAEIGPIGGAVDASHDGFAFYKSGIYYDENCSSNYFDQAVLVVGYGTADNGDKYYIIKNSWGVKWGNEGYALLARDRYNNCGIASMAGYPTI